MFKNLWYKYTLFDGLAYNTCGYFASCVAKCPLVLYAKPSNKRFIIPLQKGVILIQFYLVTVFQKNASSVLQGACEQCKKHGKPAKLVIVLYLIV